MNKLDKITLTGDGRTTVNILAEDSSHNALFVTGTSVPSAVAGYAKSCLFFKTDAGDGVKGLYENTGTTTSCSFDLIGDITSAEINANSITPIKMGTRAIVALTDAAATPTIAQLMTSSLFTMTPTASRTFTTPTAAVMVAGITGATIGTWFDFEVTNLSATTNAFAITLTAGDGGVTLVGNATVYPGSATFRAILTNVTAASEALTIIRMDDAVPAVLSGITPGTAAASKSMILDANKDLAGVRNFTLGTNGAGGAVGTVVLRDGQNPGYAATLQTDSQTADLTVHFPDPGAIVNAYVALSTAALTAAEVDVLDGATAGDGVASKAVVLDANLAHRIGDWVAAQASGSAVVFAAGLDHYSDGQLDIFSVFGESTSDLTSAYSAKCGRFRHLISCQADTDILHETYGMIGQLSVKNGSLGHYHAGIMGTFETGTLCHIPTSYCSAAVIARPGGSGTTVESGGLLAGFAAVQNMSAITATGTYAAFATHKTAAGVAWPTGLYIQSGSCTKGLDITCAAIGASGRTASIMGSIANGNLADGYGAIELQLDATGTLAGQVTALSNWINIGASAVCGANKVIAQDNGIYVPSAGTPMASAIAIIGMRMQYVAEGGENPGALHLFDTNIYSNVLTSLFRVNAIGDMGGSTGAQTGNDYKIPLFYDQTAAQLWYVNVYHT